MTKRIDGNVDLGTQAAARAPDRLILSSPFAPAECWCARTMVASSMICSKFGSAAKALKTRSQTPLRDHRLKRWNTLFQCPNDGWRSRHGAPVRNTQSTASTNRRLSSPWRPLSPSLPGTRFSMSLHCALVSSRQSRSPPLVAILNYIAESPRIPCLMSTGPSPIVLEKALTAAEATLQIARIRRLRANLIQEVRRLQILKVSSRAPSVDVQLLSRWLNREMSIRVPDDDPPRLPSQNGNRTGEAIRRLLPQLHVLAGYEWRAWLRREGALRALILGVGGRNGRSRPTKPIYSASPTG